MIEALRPGRREGPTPSLELEPAGPQKSNGSAAPARDSWLDLLRVIAIVRVVAYHNLGDGSHWAAVFSFFPSMGVMFALAGSLMARSVDRSPGRAIRTRVRRLLPPLWVLALFAVPTMLALGWTATQPDARPLHWSEFLLWVVPVAQPQGSDWGIPITEVLWYITTYLWFVLLSPILLQAFRRWPLPIMLAGLAVLVPHAIGHLDLDRLGLGGPVVLNVCTFAPCWLLGFAHREGRIRRMPLPALLVVGGAAMLTGAAWAAGHPADPGGLDLNEIPLAQALYSFGFVLVVMRFSPTLGWLRRRRILDRLVTILNSRAVTIYLWHEIALMAAVPIMDRFSLNDLPIGTSLTQLTLAWLLLGVPILLLGPVEDIAARRRPVLLPGGKERPGSSGDRDKRRARPSGVAALRPGACSITPFQRAWLEVYPEDVPPGMTTRGLLEDVQPDQVPLGRRRRPIGIIALLVVLSVLGATAAIVVRRALDTRPPGAAPLTARSLRGLAAYVAPWDGTWRDSLRGASGALTEISPVWLSPAADGTVDWSRGERAGKAGESLTASVRTWKISLVPSISNDTGARWDVGRVHEIITSPTMRRTQVDAITGMVLRQGWAGIDVDYEELPAVDRAAYSGFIEELADSLHRVNRRLSVAVRAQDATAITRPTSAYDYAAIGKVADEVRVMAYDHSWSISQAGPIAPLDWVKQVLAAALAKVPKTKVMLGAATYGYDWVGNHGQAIGAGDAIALAAARGVRPRWDGRSGSHWFSYVDGSRHKHTVWFEDQLGLQQKVDLAARSGVGVFLWKLGGEDLRLWQVFRRTA